MNKNLEELSDNEIILLIRKNDDNAMEYMLKKYSGVVKKEIRTVYLTGAEMDDLAQEGMIGLFKAIRDYEPGKGASFHTFATLCVRRQINTAISMSNRKKHIPLNTSIPIYYENGDEGYNILDDLGVGNEENNPENLVLVKEQHNIMLEKINNELSGMERNVLRMYLDGMAYSDIAKNLGKSEKSVNNALQRIRAKLSQPKKT